MNQYKYNYCKYDNVFSTIFTFDKSITFIRHHQAVYDGNILVHQLYSIDRVSLLAEFLVFAAARWGINLGKQLY